MMLIQKCPEYVKKQPFYMKVAGMNLNFIGEGSRNA